MRRLWMIPLLVFGLSIHANDTLRVDQQVLTVGDTATHVIDLLGTPVFKVPIENKLVPTSAKAGSTSAKTVVSRL